MDVDYCTLVAACLFDIWSPLGFVSIPTVTHKGHQFLLAERSHRQNVLAALDDPNRDSNLHLKAMW